MAEGLGAPLHMLEASCPLMAAWTARPRGPGQHQPRAAPVGAERSIVLPTRGVKAIPAKSQST